LLDQFAKRKGRRRGGHWSGRHWCGGHRSGRRPGTGRPGLGPRRGGAGRFEVGQRVPMRLDSALERGSQASHGTPHRHAHDRAVTRTLTDVPAPTQPDPRRDPVRLGRRSRPARGAAILPGARRDGPARPAARRSARPGPRRRSRPARGATASAGSPGRVGPAENAGAAGTGQEEGVNRCAINSNDRIRSSMS
jgi:hypothetical protein